MKFDTSGPSYNFIIFFHEFSKVVISFLFFNEYAKVVNFFILFFMKLQIGSDFTFYYEVTKNMKISLLIFFHKISDKYLFRYCYK